jgi:hypothetical protein
MANEKQVYNLSNGKILTVECLNVTESEESDNSWIKEPVYGVESVSINPETMECDVKYSMEKFLANKSDKNAPAPGKMKITTIGMGSEVVFSDGSKAKNNINDVFSSPYIVGKIKEYNDYYIKQKGYQAFTQEDSKTLKLDVTQIISKIMMSTNFTNELEIKFINGTAIYGLFSKYMGKASDKLIGMNGGRIAPFCVVYTHTDEKGKKRVIVRRLLYVSLKMKDLHPLEKINQTGGKEIGTVK